MEQAATSSGRTKFWLLFGFGAVALHEISIFLLGLLSFGLFH